MQGNFSRDTFHRQHHFSRVLLQQGRVLLDADWNEQTSIILHYLRTLAADLIGPHGGPDDGFRITCDPDLTCDFVIGYGHYYVDGILCENNPPQRCAPGSEAALQTYNTTYNTQPDYPLREDDEARLKTNTSYLVYLDVWERHMTHLQADHIREVALGGPDTATRATIVCQVKVVEEPENTPESATCEDLLRELVEDRTRCLRARARVDAPSDDPCIISPEARYRGAENQLYRVEIHDGGEGAAAKGATFKWSRDNGSVVFAIRRLQGSVATLGSLGSDGHSSLKEGDWVEVVDDRSVLRFGPRPLVQVDAVDRVSFTVTLAVPDGVELPTFGEDSTTHPVLLRWDQDSGALAVQEGKWVDLEDGVQIHFESGGSYQTGDYWLVPARTAVGDVLWPATDGRNGATVPQALPPHGIEHHYAPLTRISLHESGTVSCYADCRCTFDPTETAFSQVRFAKDSARLTDEADTRLMHDVELLEARLGADPNLRVEVRGFASRNESEPDQLARDRAEHIVGVYRQNDIAAARLSAVARGAVDPTSIPLAQQRRVETVLVSGCAKRRPVRHPVRDIDGVGETFARRLEAAGIADAAEVARMVPADLARILTAPGGRAVPESTAASIIDNAARLISG